MHMLFATGRLNRPVLFLLVAFVLLCLTACDHKPKWNVVIVTFDTTRADHLGPYGHPEARTPVIDQLAAEGVLFERASAPVPITLPSHTTLMTGKVPFTHGIRDNGLFILDQDQLTLAEILKQQGYQTAAGIASFPLTSRFGLNQGFNLFEDNITVSYEDLYGQRSFPKSRLFFDERPASRVNEAVFPWLEEHHDDPFFLWVHYFDPHHPHEPPAPYDQIFAHDLYSGEIAYADESLGRLLDRLKSLGVYDNTLVILTSDHGEGNGEHNESTHSTLMYNSTLHVPLIIRHPKLLGAGQRVKPWVGTVDVMPTILDILDLDIPEDIQGSSLWPYVETPEDISSAVKNEIYAETLSPRVSNGWGELRGLFYGDIKYIHGPRPELYDLSVDHDELNNLIQQHPELAMEMKARLETYLQDHRVEGLDNSTSVSQETLSRLRGLGYIQFSTEAVGAIDEVLRSDGEAPQDYAGLTSSFSHAKNLLFQGRAIEASRYIQSLLNSNPSNTAYQELLIQSEISRGRYEVALELLQALPVDGNGSFSGVRLLQTMAQIQLAQGDLMTALKTYQDAQVIEPSAAVEYQIARIQAQIGQTDAYHTSLNQALSLDATFVPARIDLAISKIRQNNFEAAQKHFERALVDNPYDARSLYNYGAFLIQTDQRSLAVKYLQRAMKVNSRYLRAHYALIETLFSIGEKDAANQELQALLGYAPESQEADWATQLSKQQ